MGALKYPRQAILRACLFCVLAMATGMLASLAHAQSRQYKPPAQYGQSGKPDQATGLQILADFRGRGIEGDYYFEFQLRMLPRRGETRVIPGRMWGSRNEMGPITRIALWPGSPSDEQRLLVQGGPESQVWSWKAATTTAGNNVARLDIAALFESLGGTELTAFDLQMPFIFWNDFVFEGLTPVMNRPAHTFLMYPPEEITAIKPDFTGVRMYIDTQFHALTRFEVLGPKGNVVKTFSLTEFKKAGDQWIVKAADLRNEATRDKADFRVLIAGTNQNFPHEIFSASSLSQPILPPPLETLWKVQ